MRPLGFMTDGFKNFLDVLPSEIIVVEIGSFIGESTEMFLKSGKVSFLYSIDPFDFTSDDADGFGPKMGAANVKNQFIERILKGPYADRVKHIELHSEVAAKLFEDESIDLVYIDGDHHDTFVRKDIELWSKKVKPGGIISGHGWQHKGVNTVVRSMLGEPRTFPDNTWMHVK